MLETIAVIILFVGVGLLGFNIGSRYEKKKIEDREIAETKAYKTDDGYFFSTDRAIAMMSVKKTDRE